MKQKAEPARMAEIHAIQEKIHEETKTMSVRQKVTYFRRARRELGLAATATRPRKKTA